MPGSEDGSTLADALRRYVDARNAALIVARRTLRVNEMDARALLFVATHPGTRPSNIRDHLGITSAGVTTLIDRLVDRGVVRRDVDDVDRRVNRITLTIDMGVEPWSALTRFDTQFAAAAATALGGDDDASFASALDGLTSAASR